MKHLVPVVIFLVVLTGCRDKIICPAFQSTYILDDSVRTVYYSYLWKLDKDTRAKYLETRRAADTLNTTLAPTKQSDYYAYLDKYIVPPREVEKTKYGIVKYEPYWMKNYQQRISPKENVLAPPPSPIEETPYTDVGVIVSTDFSDSTKLTLDSTAVAVAKPDSLQEAFVLPTLARAAPKKEKTPVKYLYRYDPKDSLLNVEQEYYNKYFGQLLVDNRKARTVVQPIQTQPEPTEEEVIQADSTATQGPGIRINFGKKEKKGAVKETLTEGDKGDPGAEETTEEEGDGF